MGVIGRGANRIDAARTTRTYRLTATLPANQSAALADAGDARKLLHSAGAVRTLWRSWAQCDSSTTLPPVTRRPFVTLFFQAARQPLPHFQPSAPMLPQDAKSTLSDLASPSQRSNQGIRPFSERPRCSSVSVPASAAAFRTSCSSAMPLDLGRSLYTNQPSFTTINRSAVDAHADAMCGIDWPLCNFVTLPAGLT